MTDETDKSEFQGTQDFTESGVPRRKKRPATIELEATDVTPAAETGASAESDTAPDSNAPTVTDDTAAPEAPEAETPGDAPDGMARDETVAADAPVAPPAAQAGARYAGAGMLVGAGLMGGLVAAAGLFALSYAGLMASGGNNEALEQRLARIDARLSAPAPDLGRIESELQVLSGKLATSEEVAGTVAAMGEQVRAAETAARQAQEQMARLSDTLGNLGSGDGETAAIAALGQQLAALKQDVAKLAESASAAADLSAKDAELDELRKRIGELEQAPRQDATSAREQAATVAAGALALGALERAALSGRPFAADLEAARSIAPDEPALQQLADHAASGVATREQLVAQFDAVAGDIVAADAPAEEGSAFSTLLARATSIVQVRPVGYVDGDTAAAAVARAEMNLNEGDLEGTLSELNMLKGAPREVALSFINQLEARLATEAAVQALSAGATARLGEIGARPEKPAEPASGTQSENSGAQSQ